MTTATLEKTAPPSARTQLSVDFPRQYQTIVGMTYTFRISAPESARSVEIAVDQGDWRPCRPAVGYWWFDWSGYDEGEHEAVARFVTAEGFAVSAEPHEFVVRRDDQFA
ncbi:MAG: hypothetical protein HKL90_07660 [Elusimicrobia bacterium]|nr:hypothetical protein [Elusimicrobiota bacterium]